MKVSTEIGSIAGELDIKQQEQSPLQQKLNKLGKTVVMVTHEEAYKKIGTKCVDFSNMLS